MARIATRPATIATSHVGPHQIAATTNGIRIAAVRTRIPVPEVICSFLFHGRPSGDRRQLRDAVTHNSCGRQHFVPPLPGLARLGLHFPTASAVGYGLPSLRDCRGHGISAWVRDRNEYCLLLLSRITGVNSLGIKSDVPRCEMIALGKAIKNIAGRCRMGRTRGGIRP